MGDGVAGLGKTLVDLTANIGRSGASSVADTAAQSDFAKALEGESSGDGEHIAKKAKGPSGAAFKRPNFTEGAKKSSRIKHNQNAANLKVGTFPVTGPGVKNGNGAMPHRFAWKNIKDSTELLFNVQEDPADFKRWTGRLIDAGNARIQNFEDKIKSGDNTQETRYLLEHAKASQTDFQKKRDALANDPKDAEKAETFLNSANSFHANVPDLGPHLGVNNPVGENMHLNFTESTERPGGRSPSPMSSAALQMSPTRGGPVATDSNGDIITVLGNTVPIETLSEENQNRVAAHGTKVIHGYDPGRAWI